MTLKSLTPLTPVTGDSRPASRELVELPNEYRRELVALRQIANDHETRIVALEP